MTVNDLICFLFKECKVTRALVEEHLGHAIIFVPKKSVNKVKQKAYTLLPAVWSVEALNRPMKKNRFLLVSDFGGVGQQGQIVKDGD